MTTKRRARRGVTLTEVLVALFVMALGMLALLTLFPLGAMQVGEALRYDRSAQTAAQADAFMRQYWRAQYLEALSAGRQPTDDFAWAMDDPNLLWMGAHEIQFAGQDVYVAQYVAPAAPPAGRLLPVVQGGGGITLGLPGGPSPFQPLPGPLPSLLPVTFQVPPSNVPPSSAPFYQQPVLPPQFRYATIGARPGTVMVPGNPTPKAVPSYPVFVDPLGFTARGNGSMEQVWAAGFSSELLPDPPGSPFQLSLRLPRRTVGFNPGRTQVHAAQNTLGSPYTYFLQYKPYGAFWPASNLFVPPIPDPRLYNQSLAFQTAAMTDDLTYETNGSPPPGGVVTRQGRYNWAAVVQRPRNDSPGVATLTILVFDGRPPTLATPGDEMMVFADPVLANGVGPQPGDKQLVLSLPARTPDQSVLLRRGGWIMDGTIFMAPPPLQPADGVRNNQFYRITGLTEVGPSPTIPGGTQYVADIDPPFKGPAPLFTPAAGGTPRPATQFYLFAGLTEVFERPVLKSDDKYQP